jgi:hypothetical protein
MATLDYLSARGLSVKIVGARVFVFPKQLITDQDRKFIKLHRLSLLAESSAQDGIERRMYWQVCLNGKLISVISGGPMTKDEALKSANFRWPDAEIWDEAPIGNQGD